MLPMSSARQQAKTPRHALTLRAFRSHALQSSRIGKPGRMRVLGSRNGPNGNFTSRNTRFISPTAAFLTRSAKRINGLS